MTLSTQALWCYSIYGLTVGSNHPLPHLVTTPAIASIDIHIEIVGDIKLDTLSADSAWPFSPCPKAVDETGVAIWLEPEVNGDVVRILFDKAGIPGHTEFAISSKGDHIWVAWADTLLKDALTLLLGQVMACTLRLRQLLCLHASVVRVGDHAIAMVGHKGMGKSTTAAALAQRGCPVLSDDIAVLTESEHGVQVQSGDSRLRLWPSSLKSLDSADLPLTPVMSIGEKQYLSLTSETQVSASETRTSAWHFQPQPLPLAAIYLLEQRQPHFANPLITPIPPVQGVITLVTHTSASLLPLDQSHRTREFKRLSQLSSKIPLRQINRPDDLATLPQLCDAILADAATVIHS